MTVSVIAAVTALITAFFVPYLAHRRGRQVDQVVAKTGAAADAKEGTAQAFERLEALLNHANALVDQVQEDNKDFRVDAKEFREAIRHCAAHVAQLDAHIVQVENEREGLRRDLAEARRELAAFRRRFGKLP